MFSDDVNFACEIVLYFMFICRITIVRLLSQNVSVKVKRLNGIKLSIYIYLYILDFSQICLLVFLIGLAADNNNYGNSVPYLHIWGNWVESNWTDLVSSLGNFIQINSKLKFTFVRLDDFLSWHSRFPNENLFVWMLFNWICFSRDLLFGCKLLLITHTLNNQGWGF